MMFLQLPIALGENLLLFVLLVGLLGLPILTIVVSRWLAKKQARSANSKAEQSSLLGNNLRNLASGCLISILLLAALLVVGFLLLSTFFGKEG